MLPCPVDWLSQQNAYHVCSKYTFAPVRDAILPLHSEHYTQYVVNGYFSGLQESFYSRPIVRILSALILLLRVIFILGLFNDAFSGLMDN
jgi:hypothetical protein